MSELTRSPEWQALTAHAEVMKGFHLRDLFKDSHRFENMSIDNRDLGMLLDYSKNIASGKTMQAKPRNPVRIAALVKRWRLLAESRIASRRPSS